MNHGTGLSSRLGLWAMVLALMTIAGALSLRGQTVPTMPPPPPLPPGALPPAHDHARVEDRPSIRPDPKDAAKTVQKMARHWKWLLDRFAPGDSPRRIEGFMAGKFRDAGRLYPHHGDTWELCYQLDDFLEVSFFFNNDNQFTGSFAVYTKRRWLRDLDGKILYRYPGEASLPQIFETIAPR